MKRIIIIALLFCSFLTQARTKYYRNFNNEWNNPDAWSLSSNGPANTIAPTVEDDVVFDVTSLGMTCVMYDTCYCHSITVTEGWWGTFRNKGVLIVHGGSIYRLDDTFWDIYNGQIIFDAPPDGADQYFSTGGSPGMPEKNFNKIWFHFTNSGPYYYILGYPNMSGGWINQLKIDAPNWIGTSPDDASPAYFDICTIITNASAGNGVNFQDIPNTSYGYWRSASDHINMDYCNYRGIWADGTNFCGGVNGTCERYCIGISFEACSGDNSPCPGPVDIQNPIEFGLNF